MAPLAALAAPPPAALEAAFSARVFFAFSFTSRIAASLDALRASGFSARRLLMTSSEAPTIARAVALVAERRFLRATVASRSFLWSLR